MDKYIKLKLKSIKKGKHGQKLKGKYIKNTVNLHFQTIIYEFRKEFSQMSWRFLGGNPISFFGRRRPRDRRSDAQRPHTRVIRVGMLRCTVRPSVRLYKGGSVKSPCSIWVSGHPSLIRHCTKTLHRQCCKVVFSSSLATFCN